MNPMNPTKEITDYESLSGYTSLEGLSVFECAPYQSAARVGGENTPRVIVTLHALKNFQCKPRKADLDV